MRSFIPVLLWRYLQCCAPTTGLTYCDEYKQLPLYAVQAGDMIQHSLLLGSMLYQAVLQLSMQKR